MNELIVATLQEGRVNRHDGLHPIARQARRKGDRVLLSDADVKVPVGKLLGKAHHARALTHGWRDAN